MCIWVRADYSYEHSPWLHQFARLHQGRIPPVVRPSSKWETFATPANDELVITKTSWSSTSDTGLLEMLRDNNIDTVLVCGLITSVCVQHSAFGVFEAGFRTILVTDACADRGKARHDAALALYGDYMYELRSVQSVRDELNGTGVECGRNKRCRLLIEEEDGVDGKKEKNCTIVKSMSDGSLTSATSHADNSVSSLDEEEGVTNIG